ncbi:MAG: PIN domain-containing protein [Alphaproteobacteria bacterium]|jgi:PIN domain nuclease of toxin-antitoxin system|nr:PIN domain-containing protein [Alphaproteobacteria bacterium]
MQLLLDTHVFLWWLDDGNRRLPLETRSLIATSVATFVSAVSALEIAIKASSGKLAFAGIVSDEIIRNGFIPLDVSVAHCEAVASLPGHHRDPFDRLLVAQALVEELTLVTADRRIAAYHCDIIRI